MTTTRAARLLALSLSLSALVADGAARAQVNVEGVREKIKNKPFFVSIDANVTGRLGNVNGIVAGGVLLAAGVRGDHMGFFKLSGDVAKFGQITSVAKSFAHLRYNYRILPWMNGEVFAQIQQDEFQRLAMRQVDGIGPRFGLVRREDLHVYYGTGYMFEYERLKDVPGIFAPFPGRRTTNSRWNNYISFVLELGAHVDITSVLYLQPRFDAPKDLRVLSESAVIVEIVKHLATKLTVTVRHDSLPPTGVKPTDFETTNSLSVNF